MREERKKDLLPGFWARGGPTAGCEGFRACATCRDELRGMHEWCPAVPPKEWLEEAKILRDEDWEAFCHRFGIYAPEMYEDPREKWEPKEDTRRLLFTVDMKIEGEYFRCHPEAGINWIQATITRALRNNCDNMRNELIKMRSAGPKNGVT